MSFVFCRYLKFLYKAWFPLKPLVLLKLLISTNELFLLPCMCLMNATRKNSIYLLVDEVQCHSKWKLKCVRLRVCVYVCVFNGNTSPINSLKVEDKLKMLKRKKHTQNICDIEIKWCVSEFFLKVFSLEYFRNNFTDLFFQKIRKITILIANNQLKCGIIYKKNRDARGWW